MMMQGGMTDIEYQSMFALWCLVKAPLMLGADLRTITRLIDRHHVGWWQDDNMMTGWICGNLMTLKDDTIESSLSWHTEFRESEAYKIITNPDLLAVNQDPLGIQAPSFETSQVLQLPVLRLNMG